jgi:hypothetical protein
MALLPTSRVRWRGVLLSDRTRKALEWAEKQSGLTLSPSQGSWSTSVKASGGTHDGSGVVDLRVGHLSNTQRKKLNRWLRRAGFASWLRGPADGMAPHIHAVLLSDNRASSAAKWQAGQYDRGKSGLSSGKVDNDPWRPDPVRFSWLRNRPVPRKAT